MNELFEILGKIRFDTSEVKTKLDEVTTRAKERASEMANAYEDAADKIGRTMEKLNQWTAKGFEGAGKVMQKAGESLTSKVTKPALAAGTALAGTALFKGWGRLTAIDNAQAQLKSLGLSAKEITTISDNANEAVLGTAHGLDEAFTVAAQASASGIEAGADMEQYLTRVSDAAAFAKIPMGEMGSIFNKVLTSGVAQAEELNQMADRGIPIFQMLAKELGVSESEVKKLASSGEISSDILLSAFDQIEGTAKGMGDTVQGAMSLVMSSLGRIGANLLSGGGEGTFEELKNILMTVRDIMLPIEEIASDIGKKLGEFLQPAIKSLEEFRDKWVSLGKGEQIDLIKQLAKIVALIVGIGPALQVFGGISIATGKAVGAFATLSRAIGGITEKITKAGGEVTGLQSKLITYGRVGAGAFGALAGAAGIGLLLAGLGLIYIKFKDEIDKMINVAVEKGPEIIQTLASKITEALPEIITAGTELVQGLGRAISTNLPHLMEAGGQILFGLISGVGENLPELMETAVLIIGSLIEGFILALPYLLEAGLTLLMGLIQGVIENIDTIMIVAGRIITALITAILEHTPRILLIGLQLLISLVRGILENLPQLITAAFEIVQTLIRGIGEAIPKMLSVAWELIKTFASYVLDHRQEIWDAGWEILKALGQGIIDTIDTLIDVAGQLWSDFKGFMADQDWLAIGSNIVSGIKSGIASGWESLKEWVSGKAKSLADSVTGALGINSPSKVFRDQVGRWIPPGISVGIEKAEPKLMKTLGDMSDKIVNYDLGTPNFGSIDPARQEITYNRQDRGTAGALNKMITLMQTLVDKDGDIYINGRSLSEEISDDMKEVRNLRENRLGRIRGGNVYAT